MPEPSLPTDEFIQLLTAHQPQLRGVVMAGLGSHADCEDVLQRTNLAIWRKASDFDPTRSFIAWAIGIARFEILSFIRDRRRDRHVFSPELVELLLVEAETQLDRVPERTLALRGCVAELPVRSRDLLVLKYVQGQGIREIAEATGRTLDSVKSLLLRVRKLLAECIERRLEAEAEPALLSMETRG